MISVVIIASDSERTIQECLDAVKNFEVILYLNNSTDRTKEIAQTFPNVKIIDGYFDGYGTTKNRAVSFATNDWILVLDSDEIMTKELEDELSNCNFNYQAYYVSRLNNYFGTWVKHGGLYPDYTIRLYNKNIAQFKERQVHESIDYNGKKGYLKNHFLHYCCDTIDFFIEKQNKYSTMNGKKNILKAFVSPYWTFTRMYFLRLGFLDGWTGFILAKLYSQYTFWKYIKGK